LFLVLSGCGGGNQPGSTTPAKGPAAERGPATESGSAQARSKASNQGTAPVKGPAFEGGSTTPVSAQEAARVIDLPTFPRLQGAQVQSQRLGDVTYTAPGTLQQGADFCVKNLTDAGWQELAGERRASKEGGREYLSYVFVKQGHILSATIWAADNGVGVYLRNTGNFDTRTLPRMKDAVLAAGTGSF